MAAPQIFITGTSGYVGGDVLHELLTTHPDWESHITCLLRDPKQEPLYREKYPSIRLVFATLDDSQVIEDVVAQHDLVLHFALSADHEASARAIINGLRKRGGGIYIHTGGTDILLGPPNEKASESKTVHIFNDWDGISELIALPDDAPHRSVDKIVLEAGSSTLKTAIVCPSTVFGRGRGLVSQRSEQIYNLARLILGRRRGLQLGDGKAFWNYVHVFDLSRLFVRLVEEAVAQGSRVTWNLEGYYLVESGEYCWGEVCRSITAEGYKLGILPSADVEVVGMDERALMAPAGRPVANYHVKASAVRASRLLDWRPREHALLTEIPEIVRAEARALNLGPGLLDK